METGASPVTTYLPCQSGESSCTKSGRHSKRCTARGPSSGVNDDNRRAQGRKQTVKPSWCRKTGTCMTWSEVPAHISEPATCSQEDHAILGGGREHKEEEQIRPRRRAESKELRVSPHAACSNQVGVCRGAPRKSRWYAMCTTESNSPQQPSRAKESIQERNPGNSQVESSHIIEVKAEHVAHGRKSSLKSHGPLDTWHKVPGKHGIHSGNTRGITKVK